MEGLGNFKVPLGKRAEGLGKFKVPLGNLRAAAKETGYCSASVKNHFRVDFGPTHASLRPAWCCPVLTKGARYTRGPLPRRQDIPRGAQITASELVSGPCALP